MSLNSQERELVLSVKNKIQKFNIPITLRQAFSHSANVLVNTIYNDKSFETVDAGVEIFLIKNSFAYFLENYCLVDIPGLGTVQMEPYYFQKELAKEVLDYRKIVVDKTRQCLTEDSFVMTDRGYISIKDVEIGDRIETIVNGVPKFVEVYDSFPNGEKEVCRVSVGSGLEIGCTYDHRVFTQRGWVEAGDLTIEDEILSKSGFIKVKSITPIEGLHKVYDLTTESSDFLANGLLVHNCGVSTVFSLYCLWRANFFPAESIDVISLKQLKAQQFINKMDSTLKNLPPWMKTPLTTDNKQQKIFSHPNGSKSSILSESQSDTAGRSDSLSLLVLDELAHYQSDRMVRGIISASTPALSKTGGQSILISTPNSTVGSGAYYYSQVQAAKQELESSVKYLEIDWWEIPDDLRIKAPKKGYNKVLEEAISKNYYYDRKVKAKYKEFFKPITDNYESNPWLKATYDDLGPITFKQEILHEFVIEGDRVFSEEILNRVKSKTKDPIVKDELWIDGQKIREQKGMWYWKMPEVEGRYILGCLPAGEKVLTTNGLKDIEKIGLSDILLDKNGSETKIVNRQIYEDVKEPLYTLKIEGILRKTSFTGEHPILSSIDTKISRPVVIKNGKKSRPRVWEFNFKYNNVSDIKEGDWVIYPNVYRKKELSEEDLLNKWRLHSSGRYDFDLDEKIILDKDFWWFVGIWLAEGWVYKRKHSMSINTCHNFKEEVQYVEKIGEIFKKYGRSISTRIREEKNSIETTFNSSQLYSFLISNFDKYAENKNIPEWVKFLPNKLKKELVRGYMNGDGSIFVCNESSNYRTSFVSISKKMLEDFQDILFSLGAVSTLSILRPSGETLFEGRSKKSNTKEAYQLSLGHHESIKFMDILEIDYDTSKLSKVRRSIGHNFLSEDLSNIYLRISSIEKEDFSGTVYNFETESHSYLCNYLTTHNCDVSSGTGTDTSTIQVLNLETYEQVAEFKGYISTPAFARLVKEVARAFNDGYIVVESNGIGDTIFSNIYYSEHDPYGNVFKQKRTKNGITRFTGWITDVKTRKLMTSEFIDWVTVPELSGQFKINSERLLLEMETWVWKDGKPIHASNCHDDAIMAMGLCLHLRDKAQVQGGAMFLSEDGSVITYDREKIIREAKASNDTFSSIDGTGKRRTSVKGGNPAGIVSSTEDFGTSSYEKELKETYNVRDLDELRWLIG